MIGVAAPIAPGNVPCTVVTRSKLPFARILVRIQVMQILRVVETDIRRDASVGPAITSTTSTMIQTFHSHVDDYPIVDAPIHTEIIIHVSIYF